MKTTTTPKCRYCYDKGYSTVMYDEIGAEDFGGEGYINRRKEVNKPCTRCAKPLS